jgi:hypothetical protein
MTGPFQTVLGRIPKGVLAGLFWYMGSDALFTSGVTALFLYLIRDRHFTSPTDPLHRVRKSRIFAWLMIELLGFAATFAITQTIAAIGEFPRVVNRDSRERADLGLDAPGRLSCRDHCDDPSKGLRDPAVKPLFPRRAEDLGRTGGEPFHACLRWWLNLERRIVSGW